MYVTKIINKLRHGLPWFLINLLGLSTAMACLKRNLFAVPLIAQFTLSVIAITATIALYRQMDYIQNQHPASRNADILVIADNP